MFFGPFPSQKFLDSLSPGEELVSVPPDAVGCISRCDEFRISSV